MSKKTKLDQTLNRIITEFEDFGRLSSPQLREEKSYIRLIQYYEKHRLFDKALEVSDIAITTYPYRVDFYILKSKILLATQKPQETIEILYMANQISPYETQIPLLKAKALCQLGELNSALQLIDEVRHSFHKADSIEILLVEAFIQESMKDYDKMFYTLREALRINPNNTEALEQIWVSVEISKKYDESIKLHQELIDKNPYSYLAWYNLGHAYSCMGEYDQAMEALEYSFLINPHFESGYMDCAELCLQVSNYDKALTCFTEANEMFGPDPELAVNIAECLIKLNRHSEAKKYLQRSIDQDPFNDEIFFYLGECYKQEENWTKALKYYHEAIDLDDYREEFHAGIAEVYVALGQAKKAESHYRKAATCGMELSRYWALYLNFLLKTNQLEKANKSFIKADKYSFGADILFCKSAYYFLIEENDKAYACLEEALQENSDEIGYFSNILPEKMNDPKVKGMLKYFSPLI